MSDEDNLIERTVDPTIAIKKACLFVAVCLFLPLALITIFMPYSFQPFYNEARDISPVWTGVILSSASFGSIVGQMVLPPFLMSRFRTSHVLSGNAFCYGIVIASFAITDLVDDKTVFTLLSVAIRIVLGILGGSMNTTVFVILLSIYPNSVGVSTAIAETVLNGSLASAPFIGALLYSHIGYKGAAIAPATVVFLSGIPAMFIPVNIQYENTNEDGITVRNDEEPLEWSTKKEKIPLKSSEEPTDDDKKTYTSLWTPMLLFPIWHLFTAQVLMTYHMPIIPLYAETTFGVDVVWSGTALMTDTAVLCAVSPILGVLVDKYCPYKMLVASAVCLPLAYIFIGPLPLLTFVSPSKLQLVIALGFLGLAVPMACIPVLAILFDQYRRKNQGELPQHVFNLLISLYTGAYGAGAAAGSVMSGFIAPYVSFGWSTGALGLLYMVESVACVIYCLIARRPGIQSQYEVFN